MRPPIPADAKRFWRPAYPDVPRTVVYRYGYTWSVDGRRYDVHDQGERVGGPCAGDYADLRQRYHDGELLLVKARD